MDPKPTHNSIRFRKLFRSQNLLARDRGGVNFTGQKMLTSMNQARADGMKIVHRMAEKSFYHGPKQVLVGASAAWKKINLVHVKQAPVKATRSKSKQADGGVAEENLARMQKVR